jgi:adenylate cyclase
VVKKHKDQVRELIRERKLAVIMFTDMVGYTAKTQLDESLALELLEEHRRILRPIFRKYGGLEIDAIGDAFLVEFASAREAAKCALEIQTILKNLNETRPEHRRILLRIGIHLGDVVHKGKKVSGDAVNVASRIEPLATAGGICLTAQVYYSVYNKLDCKFESLGNPHLKNVSMPLEVFRINGFGVAEPPVESELASTRSKTRIAVLPFANMSPNPDDEYFADGMTEELISTISKIASLQVIARTSVVRYKGSNKSIDEIGKDLDVGTILEGSVRKSNDKLRITAQLIDARTSEHLWSESYNRDLKDVFALQSEISETVANALKVKLLPQEKAKLEKEPTKNTEAYSLCLKGMYYFTNASSDQELRKAERYFEKAIGIDPHFALAYSWQADCLTTLVQAGHLRPVDTLPLGEKAAWKALELDPDLADAHRALGFLLIMRKDHNWKGAEREIRKALELNPNVPGGHDLYAWFLQFMGRLEDARTEAKKALELNPLSTLSIGTMALCLYYHRDYDLAITEWLRGREIDPGHRATSHGLGLCYLEKSEFDLAIEEFKKTLDPSKGRADFSLSYLGMAYARSGKTEEARKILNDFKEISENGSRGRKYVPALATAWIHVALGEKREALDLLEKAYENGDLMSLQDIKVSPIWDGIRSEPRYGLLLKKMGLE